MRPRQVLAAGEEHLAELFRTSPREVVKFLRILLGVGTLTSLVMITYTFPTIMYYEYAHQTGNLANWLLYWWLGGVCIVQLAQIPLRLRMHNRLAMDVAALPRDNIIHELFELASSMEWRLNKHIGTMAYGLFLAGSFFTSFARHLADQTDSELHMTVVVSLAALAARMAFSFCWFFFSFIYRNDMPQLLGTNARAADEATIAANIRFYEWQPAAKQGEADPTGPSVAAVPGACAGSETSACTPSESVGACSRDVLPRLGLPLSEEAPSASVAVAAAHLPCAPGGASPTAAERASVAAGYFVATTGRASYGAAAAKPSEKMDRDLLRAEAKARRWAERISAPFLRRRRRARASPADADAVGPEARQRTPSFEDTLRIGIAGLSSDLGHSSDDEDSGSGSADDSSVDDAPVCRQQSGRACRPGCPHEREEGRHDVVPASDAVSDVHSVASDPAPVSSLTGEAVRSRSQSSSEATCAVCLSEFCAGQVVAALPCNATHIFHRECIVPWLKVQKRCPLCTMDIDEPRPAPTPSAPGAAVAV